MAVNTINLLNALLGVGSELKNVGSNEALYPPVPSQNRWYRIKEGMHMGQKDYYEFSTEDPKNASSIIQRIKDAGLYDSSLLRVEAVAKPTPLGIKPSWLFKFGQEELDAKQEALGKVNPKLPTSFNANAISKSDEVIKTRTDSIPDVLALNLLFSDIIGKSNSWRNPSSTYNGDYIFYANVPSPLLVSFSNRFEAIFSDAISFQVVPSNANAFPSNNASGTKVAIKYDDLDPNRNRIAEFLIANSLGKTIA